MCSAFVAINYWKIRYLRTRKIPRLRKIIFPLLLIIIEIEVSLIKLWVSPPKRIFFLNKKTQQNQFSNIPIIGNNITVVKKDNKQDNKDLSEINYYSYHEKGHYASNYPNKEPKKECQSWEPSH